MKTLVLTRRPDDLLRRFGGWWFRQFLELFSAEVLDKILGRGRTLLVLEPTDQAIAFELLAYRQRCLAKTQVLRDDYGPTSIEEFLGSFGLDISEVDLGLKLPSEYFFVRELLLPAHLGANVGPVAMNDLLLKTPFRLEDICHGYSATSAPGSDKTTVWQWVVKHEFIRSALSAAGLQHHQIAFVVGQKGADTRQPAPFIWLNSDAKARSCWSYKLIAALVLIGVAFAIASGVEKYQRQDSMLGQLEAQIAVTREKAQRVRLAVDRLEGQRSAVTRLRARKTGAPGLLDVWEEITRLLPAHSYLTELRISESADSRERRISLLGFSEAATGLIGILDRSPLLSNVALTAPVAMDPLEKRERFALQATVYSSKSVKEASR